MDTRRALAMVSQDCDTIDTANRLRPPVVKTNKQNNNPEIVARFWSSDSKFWVLLMQDCSLAGVNEQINTFPTATRCQKLVSARRWKVLIVESLLVTKESNSSSDKEHNNLGAHEARRLMRIFVIEELVTLSWSDTGLKKFSLNIHHLRDGTARLDAASQKLGSHVLSGFSGILLHPPQKNPHTPGTLKCTWICVCVCCPVFPGQSPDPFRKPNNLNTRHTSCQGHSATLDDRAPLETGVCVQQVHQDRKLILTQKQPVCVCVCANQSGSLHYEPLT